MNKLVPSAGLDYLRHVPPSFSRLQSLFPSQHFPLGIRHVFPFSSIVMKAGRKEGAGREKGGTREGGEERRGETREQVQIKIVIYMKP